MRATRDAGRCAPRAAPRSSGRDCAAGSGRMNFLATLKVALARAARQQAAQHADDARHHHRRRRGDHDDRDRRGRAGARRGPDQEPRLEPDHRAARQLHGGRRAHGRGLAADAHRGRRATRCSASSPRSRPRRRSCAAPARSCSATATGRRRSSASRRSTSMARELGARVGTRLRRRPTSTAPAKVVLLGQTVARKLFGEADPIGQTIRVRNVPHGHRRARAQGPEHGGPGPGRRRPDADLDRAQARARRAAGASSRTRRLDHGKVRDGADMAQAEQQIRDLLRQRHRLQPSQEDDFTLRNLSEVLAAQEASSTRDDAAARGGRVGLAARRRHRHHEHHAGVGDRAHARDRPAHGGRRARPRHPDAVPGRGGDARR